MAEVRPFSAIRYDHTRRGGDLSDVIAPPYDVLEQADKDALLARSDRNIVAIDLPHVPPKSLGPPEAYERSARTLAAWLRDGTLVREQGPALYVYHQAFEHGGRRYVRRKFIARVRLVPFEEGVVLPHEQTFGGPKEDRLALTKATRCNVSPVFALYADPENAVGKALEPVTARPPDVVARMEEVENRVWIVTDPAVLASVAALLKPKQVFIADGHHRYGTALQYLQHLTERDGPLPPEHPARYVMIVLGSMDDPGSLILPYHRVLVGPDATLAALTRAWAAGCEEVKGRGDRTAQGAVGHGAADLLLYEGRGEAERAVRFTNRAVLQRLEPDRSEAWRSLDVAYLHRYLIEELAAKLRITVRYVKSADAARALVRQEQGVALLMNATRMEQLRAVSEAGELMPQKSTFFYPKLATGLALNPLYESP